MGVTVNPSLALIVRSHPYQQRSSRAEFDMALAAVLMDFRLEVYFVGAALLQLITNRDSRPALLPAGFRAWASLPDLGEVTVFAETPWLEQFPEPEFSLIMPVEGITIGPTHAAWRSCDYSMVL